MNVALQCYMYIQYDSTSPVIVKIKLETKHIGIQKNEKGVVNMLHSVQIPTVHTRLHVINLSCHESE